MVYLIHYIGGFAGMYERDKDINNPDNNSTDYLNSIIEKGYGAARDNNWRFNRGLGTWDDQSCWCVTITTGNILGSNMNKEKIGKHRRANLKKNKKRQARKRYRNRNRNKH